MKLEGFLPARDVDHGVVVVNLREAPR